LQAMGDPPHSGRKYRIAPDPGSYCDGLVGRTSLTQQPEAWPM
jgi:hypothetical protein